MSRPGWDVAYDHQTDLIRQATSSQGRRYIETFAESFIKHSVVDPKTGERSEGDHERTYQMIQATVTMLPVAEPMFVSGDLADIINYAAEKWTIEPLLQTDLLCPAGFAYFERPIESWDTHGKLTYFRAMQWCLTTTNPHGGDPYVAATEPTGVLLAFYGHKDDNDDYGPLPGKVGGSDLTLSHVTNIGLDDPNVGNPLMDRSVLHTMRHTQVFFRLCQQTIAVRRQERASRPVWKRAANWRQIKEVTVFILRRSNGVRYEGEREVEWTHRWMVNAHWRNQPYKNPDGSTYHRQIWIAPYVKGPDDRPLILKRRAFELVR